jgi:hypothetical protein
MGAPGLSAHVHAAATAVVGRVDCSLPLLPFMAWAPTAA